MDFLSNVGRREQVAVNEVGRFVALGNKSLNGYERNCLYRNLGPDGVGEDGVVRFQDAGFVTGADSDFDGRAMGLLDIEGDGDLDMVIQNFARPATLMVNTSAGLGHWLQVRLRGPGANMDAVGARLEARIGDRVLVREQCLTSGYLSGQSACVHFGLGDAVVVDELTVRWPDGTVTVQREVPADRLMYVTHPAVRGAVDASAPVGG